MTNGYIGLSSTQGVDPRTSEVEELCSPWLPLLILGVHTLRHEIFDSPDGVPIVVGLDEMPRCILAASSDLELVVC